MTGLISIKSLGDIQFARATTEAQFDAICRLRYHAYHSQGFIAENKTRYFDDAYDQQPNALNFSLTANDTLVGAVRLIYFDPQQPSLSTPARDAYADVLQTEAMEKKKFIDSNRFVVNRDLVGDNRFTAIAVIKLALIAGHLWQIDYGTATARTSHYAFYKRYIHAEEWAPPRAYPSLNVKLGLLMCDFQKHREKFIARFGAPTEADRAMFPDYCLVSA